MTERMGENGESAIKRRRREEKGRAKRIGQMEENEHIKRGKEGWRDIDRKHREEKEEKAKEMEKN